jgi:N-methylhydantoinase A
MRMATDIGGTFTDLVYVDDATGKIGLAKASSTPPAFSQGIMDAIDKSDVSAGNVEHFVHGTTVIINALTERNGAETALVTTRGCRDVLEIGRANRPDIYNLRFRKQPTFVPRELRFEVSERVNYKGEIVEPLAMEELDAVAAQIRGAGCEAVAVAFLHSYANDEHERAAADRLREILPGVEVSASSEITREWREYERTSTVVLNAYVRPVAASYLGALEDGLTGKGMHAPLDVMKSNGGTATFALSREQPIHMVESGPVGGVIGAAAIGKHIGEENLITLDIGGTTAKCSLIDQGEIKVSTEYRIERDARNAGYPIKIPVVDIVEIGAGGGSIAWIDKGGALKIGPKSAGAVPGPACYGQGGADPTVTDANVVAGRINPDYFLGGEIRLDVDLARESMEQVSGPLDIDVEEAALGIIRLANANMINALKLVSVRRGYDPREFTLIAFGGGGAMHAAALAAELHVGQVLIPPAPGHFSAWGMLMSDAVQDFVRTRLTPSTSDAEPAIGAMLAEMEQGAVTYFGDAGYDTNKVRIARFLDMRYLGQEHTVRVPVDEGRLDTSAINDRFHALHERAYTFRLDSLVEIVNYHISGAVERPKPAIERPEPVGSTAHHKATRDVLYDGWGRLTSAIYERSELGPGVTIHGPAIIEEQAATTVVYPGMTAGIDEAGNIAIRTGAGR